MSIRVASLVRKYGPLNHANYVVLLALADHANDAGEECWPSVRAIAAEMRIGERSVARSLSVLEIDGWILVMRRSREHRGNSYKIVMEKLKSPAYEAGGRDESHATETGDKDDLPATEAGEKADVTCQPVQSDLPNPPMSPAKPAFPILKNRPEPSLNRPLAPSVERPRSAPEEAAVFTLPLKDGTEYGVPQKLYDKYTKAYPALSVMEQFARMDAWLASKPKEAKTRTGMPAFMNSWLKREVNQPKNSGGNYGRVPLGKTASNLGVLERIIARRKSGNGAPPHGLLSAGGNGGTNCGRLLDGAIDRDRPARDTVGPGDPRENGSKGR